MYRKKILLYFLLPWLAMVGFVIYSITHAHVAVCLSNYLPLALLWCLCWLMVPTIRGSVIQFGLLPLLSFSWIVLLGRLLLPLFAGPQWLRSMAMLYQVKFYWLSIGDVLLHFGCFFAVQWVWLWQAQAFKQTWRMMSKWRRWLAGYWILVPYTIWLLSVNPLIVYKVSMPLLHVKIVGWLYGLLVVSFCCVWVACLCIIQKRLKYNRRLFWWVYIMIMVFILLLAAYVNDVSPSFLVHLVVIPICLLPSIAVFSFFLLDRVCNKPKS